MIRLSGRRSQVPAFTAALATALAAALWPHPAAAQPAPAGLEPSILSVTGRGEVQVEPDRAVVRLGAQAQADKATAAQAEVDEVVGGLLQALAQAGVPQKSVQTSTLVLTPVYRHDQERIRAGALEPEPSQDEPQIVGYRATNTLQVTVDDLAKLGSILDAAIGAGVNQIEGISFHLRDDRRQREEALRLAVQEAETKALAMADAAGARLVGLARIEEGGIGIIGPMMEQARLAMADAGQVQPGLVTVEANVTIQYRIRAGRGPGR